VSAHDDIIRFGILGAAAIGPAALVRPARRNSRVEVTAVAARDRQRAQDFALKHGIPRVLQSYDELVADPDIDAVYIPLPNGLHGMWTRRAIEAGKHVLCEKPFTANSTEAAEIADLVHTTDRVVMEAFHWRYHPMADRLVEIVNSGEIGRVRHIEASICFPLLRPSDIRYRLDLAGGALMDAGCYAVNIVRTVVGTEPTAVEAHALMTRGGVDRAFTGRLRFPDDVTGAVTCSMMSSRLLSLSVRVRGTEGDVRAWNPLMPKLFGSLRVRSGEGRRTERAMRTDTYRYQLEAFADAVLQGRSFPSTVDDAVRNMRVIDDLYRAAGLSPREPTAP
jgi:predicted dehydrogenase